MSINRVVISGNLTRDPDLRQTASGMSVLSLGVAVNDRRRNQAGEWEDYANFIDCTMFGTRADRLSQYLHKGTKVTIEGKLRWSQWQDKQGNNRSKVEVIIDDLEFMSSRNDNGNGGYSNNGGYNSNNGGYSNGGNRGQAQQSYQAPAPAPSIDASSSVYDEDIPF